MGDGNVGFLLLYFGNKNIYKQTNKYKNVVYCQSQCPQRSCIISTNLDRMIRLIYMISILIIYMYTNYIYLHVPFSV